MPTMPFKNSTLLYIPNNSSCTIDTVPFIETKGLDVLETSCLETACDLFSHHKIDIILIDIESRDKCGLEFIKYLREKNILTPAIITTNDIHKVPLFEALNLEISSCLVHPYSPEELLNALKKAAVKADIFHPLAFTDLDMGFSYDPLNKIIIAPNAEIIKLCNKESMLIELLLQNKEHITTYDMIETIVWKDDYMSIDSLRTLIRGIRKKTYQNIISNYNGIGYKIGH